MPQTEKRSYRDTLNLPKTAFPMKANLVQNEPASMKRWAAENLYAKLRELGAGRNRYVFHDGPPYANGSIHLGHLLNKVLKDIVVRSRTMAGFDVPYIPGWDCHGLPIEHKVMQELGDKARDMQPIQIRRKCKAYAEKFVKLQAGQMQRLLTLADYDNPYLTMAPEYERAVLEVFAKLVEKGLVYRQLKPVHWSIANQTALAEAELEYEDREDVSVYVRFPLHQLSGYSDTRHEPLLPRADLLIWTTTPWTLPANLAVAVHPTAEYGVYRTEKRALIIAVELAQKVLALIGESPGDPVRVIRGDHMQRWSYSHPFLNDGRDRRVVTADYVTLEDGTGLVHTAPGHGTEDYQTGLRENLDIYCPVGEDGRFDETVPDWLRDRSVWEANDLVIEKLRASGHLFHAHKFTHSYPHDWRSKTPVIFRATEQWFVAVDREIPDESGHSGPTLRKAAMAQIESNVTFHPAWGRNRMRGMLESRPDWCVSRQRAWGLPIPAFLPPEGVEGEPLLTAASVRAVAECFGRHGSDAWFVAEPHQLLESYDPASDPDAPAWLREMDLSQGLQSAALRKAHDIFDVWFESGSSWSAALERMQGDYPADLYLEGSDQHRGWFQLSLLPAVAVTGRAPFREVLTHGFMVDKDGKKMSKSLGNALEVEELFKDFGADVCRWWVFSLNTENDIKVDLSFFKVAGEEYRKVRNTIRFLLSNLSDFDPAKDAHTFTEADAMSPDAWALGELNAVVEKVRSAFENFTYRKAHEAIFNFCNETLSAVYLVAVKDRLYCDPPAPAPGSGSSRRQRTQTAIHNIADALIRTLAPVLPHTADEAWRALHGDAAASVHLVLLPERINVAVSPKWQSVIAWRERAMKTIEEALKQLGGESSKADPLACGLKITGGDAYEGFDTTDLADLFGISKVEWIPGSGGGAGEEPVFEVLDLRDQPRCERSWKRDGTVKLRSDGGMLSDRDAAALGLR